MEIDWTPAMRALQGRIAAGREHVRAHPDDAAARGRLYALGLWLAEEVVTGRMQAGCDHVAALPRGADIAPAVARIWGHLWPRAARYADGIEGADAAVGAERGREEARRYREAFLTDEEYRGALADGKARAPQGAYAQRSLLGSEQ